MYKDKMKQRANTRDRVRRYRDKAKGVTEGVTLPKGVTAMQEPQGVTYPDILDKLTDPVWRDRLAKICAAFKSSHYPGYVSDVWIGETNLAVACDWLACL